MSELSLFIVGMPRSGTKLLRSLLNNHNDIFIPEIESLFIPQLLKKYGNRSLSSEMVDEVIDSLQNSLFFFYYSKSKSFNFDLLRQEGVAVKELIDIFFEEVARLENKNVKFLGDKSPNYIFEMNLLMGFYPNAKFIHIVRDPRDYALSMKKTWNKNMYRAAYRWSEAMSRLYRISQKKEERRRIVEIKYEDLIQSPKNTLQSVCKFLGLEFHPSMLELSQSVELIGDARESEIESANSQKYLSELSEREQLKIEKLTAKFLKYYAYPIPNGIIHSSEVSKFKKLYWKVSDVCNLIRFNVHKYGLKKGLDKLIKAAKHL